ncbi:MAG: peptidoglycan-binding domain-containing protein [Deltaproteobacteria bacterium]|nr:peptidoglycan-binding domain-containing protein [Deltaproteobacteria bacterium]
MPDITVSPSPSPAPGNVTPAPSPGTPAPGTPPPPTTTTAPVSDGFEASASLRQRKAAEKALGVIGYRPGAVDGRITAPTRAALEKFQHARGLEKTGELDRKTYSDLRAVEKQTKKGVQTAGLLSSGTKKVEQHLKRLGYDVGAADGLFTGKTADAVKAFKRDQGMNQSGSMGEQARKVLNKEIGALAHKPNRCRVKNTNAHKAADRGVERESKQPGGVSVGDRGAHVAHIQRHLRAAGFDPKSAGGVFDERTAGMVKEFQKKSGLEATGKVGFTTWKKLRGAQMEARTATSPKQDIGERSGAVKRTETLLKKLGFNPGAVDGTYDARTQQALDRFRKRFDLGSRGQGVGPATLKALKSPPLNLDTVKGCAQFLLRSNNVSYWTGLSSGSDRANIQRLANGGRALVPATGGSVVPKLAMMQALVAMAKQGPIMINALTGGTHSSNSNHYRGTAVDLEISVGNTAEIQAIGRRYGGIRNFETSHIHMDF